MRKTIKIFLGISIMLLLVSATPYSALFIFPQTTRQLQSEIQLDEFSENSILFQSTIISSTEMYFTYPFDTPQIHYTDQGSFYFTFETTYLETQPYHPVIPKQTIIQLLPEGKEIEDIIVTTEPAREIPSLLFTEKSILFGTEYVTLEGTQTAQSIPPVLSNSHYPAIHHTCYPLQHLCGYSLVYIDVYPLLYEFDATETLTNIRWYPSFSIHLVLTDTLDITSPITTRNTPNDIARIRDLITSPDHLQELATTYTINHPEPVRDTDSLVDPDDSYQYVIITNEALRDATGEYTFQDLLDIKNAKGITATLVTTEDIITCPAYWWNGAYGDQFYYNDTQAHIRNFIRDAYQNWETEYVLLGGDGDPYPIEQKIIPTRLFRSPYGVGMGYGNELAADLYYACLDGSFDENHNFVFGEIDQNDGSDIDGSDLLAEVFVGRAPVDNAEELSNFIRKTLSYETSDGQEYLRNISMVAEHLGFGGYAEFGGYSKEEIHYGSDKYGYTTAGIPIYYDVSTLYDMDWTEYGWEMPQYGTGGWPKQLVIDIINRGAHIINHLGHGNNYHVMKLDEPIIMQGGETYGPCHDIVDNLTNDEYLFVYSQACFPGAFDNRLPDGTYGDHDSIVEYFLTDDHGAFAFVGNSGFGWGRMGTTNGPSQYYDRQFFDVLFGDNQTRSLGKANQLSKERNIGYISNPVMRYCYYDITYFGDPELCIKDPPRQEHDLAVASIDIPSYIDVNELVTISSEITNIGRNSESDVVVHFSINSELIDTVIISEISPNETRNVNTSWSHSEQGYYTVTISIEPVPDESSIQNNEKEQILVVTNDQRITIAALDSITTDFLPHIYDYLNQAWYSYGLVPILIDYESLNKENITYEEICETNADVLLVHAAVPFFSSPYQFTLSEMAAIRQYVEEGHRIVVVWQCFGNSCPNNQLLPLIGLNISEVHFDSDGAYEVNGDLPTYSITNHPVFSNLPSTFTMYSTASVTPEPYKSWDERYLLTGTYLGFMKEDFWSYGAILINLDNSVYISSGLEQTGDDNAMQLFYNAFAFPYFGEFSVTAQSPSKALVNTPVQFYSYVTNEGGECTWSWDFGDGTTSAERNPIHTYTTVGEYTVSLTLTNELQQTATDTFTVVVKEVLADAYIHHSGATNWPLPEWMGHHVQGVGGTPPYTYYWDFGDGGTSTEHQPLHIYNSAGDFPITVTVTDNQSNSDTVEQGIHVTVGPMYIESIESNLGDAHRAVTYQPVQFFATIHGGITPYSYDWDFGDGSAHSFDVNPVHCYTEAGSYRIILIITDAEGTVLEGTVNDYPIWITDYTPLSVTTSDRTAVVGKRCAFSFSKDGGVPPYSYRVDWGDQTFVTGSLANQSGSIWLSLYHTYAWVGTFNFTITITDYIDSCVSATKTVTVGPSLQVTHDGPYTGTVGETISFTCSVTGGIPRYNYCIDVDGDPSDWDFRFYYRYDTSMTVHYQYTTPGRYDVRFYVYDSVGCQAYANTSIVVGLPGELVVNAGGPYEGSVGLPVCFRGSYAGATVPNPIIRWEFGDDTSANTLETTHAYSTEGTFSVQLSVSDEFTNQNPEQGASDQTTANITHVEPLMVTIRGPYNGISGVPVPFSCIVSGGYPSYSFHWECGDGNTVSEQNPCYAYQSPGIYTVNLTVRDSARPCQIITVSTTATIIDALVADAGGPYSGIMTKQVEFFGVTSGGLGPLNYTWAFGDGTFSYMGNPRHIFDNPGEYPVTFTVRDSSIPPQISIDSTTATIIDDTTTLQINISLSKNHRSVIVELLNNGQYDATTLHYELSITGGFLNRINYLYGATIPSLEPNQIQQIQTESGEIKGIGKIAIHAEANASNADLTEKDATAFIFGRFIFGLRI